PACAPTRAAAVDVPQAQPRGNARGASPSPPGGPPMIPTCPQAAPRALLLALGLLASATAAGLLVRRPDPRSPPEPEGQEGTARRLDRLLREVQECAALKARLGEDVLAGRCTLAEAVGRLARLPHGRNPLRQASYRMAYPGLTEEECLAANLADSV